MPHTNLIHALEALSPAVQVAVKELVHRASQTNLDEGATSAALRVASGLLGCHLQSQSSFALETAAHAVRRDQPHILTVESTTGGKTDVHIALPGEQKALTAARRAAP